MIICLSMASLTADPDDDWRRRARKRVAAADAARVDADTRLPGALRPPLPAAPRCCTERPRNQKAMRDSAAASDFEPAHCSGCTRRAQGGLGESDR